MNFYFIKKAHTQVALQIFQSYLFKVLLTVIILTPVATIFFSHRGPSYLATVTGFIGYSWIAFLFLFLTFYGFSEIIVFIIKKSGLEITEKIAAIIFYSVVSAIVFILVYGFFEAGRIQLERVVLHTHKLKSKIRIVQISDIHFSSIINSHFAKKIVGLVNQEHPDIIALTGDYLDRGVAKPEEIIQIMRNLKATTGKYAVPGNHEFFAGIQLSSDFMKQSGFILLRNETVQVGQSLNIGGIDDPAGKQFSDNQVVLREQEIFQGIDTALFTILLKHQPVIDNNAKQYFNLQLSGHTHGGQIFPFTFLVRIAYPYICGLYHIDDQTNLYVNRGTGTWGPPFRFLAPPEITVIDIFPKE